MTNSEAIEKINELFNEKMFWDDSIESYNFELTKSFIISSLEENDKLKAEIEQFSNELISVRIENELLKKKNELTNHYFEQYSAAIDEIKKLKELTRYQQEFSVDNKTIGQLSSDEYIEFIKSILWKNYDATKEIEQLKYVAEVNENLVKTNDKQNRKINQLEEELHQLKHRNCLQCFDYGKCSINDNFNITNCSDFKLKGKVSE